MKTCSCCKVLKNDQDFRIGRNQCKQCDNTKKRIHNNHTRDYILQTHQCECGGTYTIHQKKKHERTQKHTNYVKGIAKLKQNDTWICSCGYSCAYKYKDKHKVDSKCHWWWLNQSITKPLTIKFKQLWRHHIEEFDKYSSKAEDIFKTYSQRHQSNSNEEEDLEKEFQKQFL